MYTTDRWGAPTRRRTPQQSQQSDSYDTSPQSLSRPSTGNQYYGMDGSSSSGGFSQIPSGGLNSRPASGGYNDSEQSGGGGGAGVGGQRDPHVKINQIVQAFFWKAAMIIIERRIPTTLYTSSRTGEKMVNRWFNIELDEIDTLKKDCEYWRHTDAYSHPKPMIVEVYLDTSELSATQALVILDSRGSRWNVNEALESAASRAGLNMSYKGGPIVLERWKIALSPPHDINPNMEAPSVYKQAIILFRTLWSYINLMPVWKFKKKLAKTVLHSSILKLGIRIMDSDEHAEASRRWDGLRVPLFPGESNQVTEEHAFEKVESPAGNMNISVSFRRNCDFKVDESEALLSSQFINLDEHYFRPTRHQRTASQPTNFPPPPRLSGEAGSLPAHLASRESPHSNPQNHYGSLSSFHNYNTGTSASPLSQLRGIDMHRAASSNGSPASAMRSVNGSNSSLPRGATGTDPKPADRRASISSSFQPFKAPSLSSSPAPGTDYAPARMGTPASLRSRGGIGGISGTSYGVTGSGTSYTAGGAYKSSTPDNQSGIPIGSQPMTRIASSFGSRRPRNISTSAREADDNNSSGGASYSSSMAAPGSGLYSNPNNSNPYTAGSGGGANPLSFEEDLEITAFLNLMADGQKTQLKSFGPAAAKNRQTELDSLSKFREMRDSQAVLADSMNSSVLLQQQQPAGSVGSGAGGSSLGKTPHTPIIPSRLSNHTAPLDIPTSPRFMGPRRANSMSQQSKDFDGFGNSGEGYGGRASVSLGDRGAIRHAAGEGGLMMDPDTTDVETQDSEIRNNETDVEQQLRQATGTALPELPIQRPSLSNNPHRASTGSSFSRGRFSGGVSRGWGTPTGDRRTPSWSARAGQEQEDELLFAMSEMNVEGRKSTEQQLQQLRLGEEQYRDGIKNRLQDRQREFEEAKGLGKRGGDVW